MAEPTKLTVKRLFALSGNICAFPGCSQALVESSGVVIGEICHIHARNKGGPRYKASLRVADRHSFENLILLCGCHHKVIDSQPTIYTAETLFELKFVHESAVGCPESEAHNFYAQILLNSYRNIEIVANSGNISINSPGTIQGQNVTIKTECKKVKVEPPPGSLGADLVMSKYIAYLIKRYNEFASKDTERKTKFSYGAISKNIEDKFGARWQLLSMEYSATVVAFLHGRINKTKQACYNRGNGYQSYSTLLEYTQKYRA